jgi:hypothetical protein
VACLAEIIEKHTRNKMYFLEIARIRGRFKKSPCVRLLGTRFANAISCFEPCPNQPQEHYKFEGAFFASLGDRPYANVPHNPDNVRIDPDPPPLAIATALGWGLHYPGVKIYIGVKSMDEEMTPR